MPGLKSIRLALQVATGQRDDAGKVLAQIQRGCSDAQNQMAQLESYAAQTESRWSLSSQVLATPEIVHHYYQFMARLQQAIDLQGNVVADLRHQTTVAQRLMLEFEIRIASLGQVLERKHAVALRLQAGREQKQNDEFAALQHRRMLAAKDNLGAA